MENNKFKAFPSIGQFRNSIKRITDRSRFIGKDENGDPIYNTSAVLPKIAFIGTVKLHGSNSVIYINKTSGEFHVQSRNNIISAENDNAGCAKFNWEIKSVWENLVRDIPGEEFYIACEWAGKGIQKGVAVSELPRFMAVLNMMIDGKYAETADIKKIENPENRIFNVFNIAPVYRFEIDFEKPDLVQNQIFEEVNAVEKECPVGKYFGISGIGEGIVFMPEDSFLRQDSDTWFKAKGKKHQVSKVITFKPADSNKMQKQRDFIEATVTEARLIQGLTVLREKNIVPEMKVLGDYIRWVVNDILKEDSDRMSEYEITEKELGKLASDKTRKWFIANFNKDFWN